MKEYSVQNMKRMRLQGKTLQSIGDHYGLTRERVRQLLVENYGTSIETDILKRIENEVKEYQWDSGNSEDEAKVIAKRIHAIFYPMNVNKKDPLSALIF